ncbi:hypothetical protein U1769_12185 [Sphingomonas sp. ZT3P38]|jgi:hypothetical protein|uniref:hypothetical protein n=1 Tax=Parasphingomonas zepuensis TaxID=3096161 RepID=UPI002FC5BA7A
MNIDVTLSRLAEATADDGLEGLEDRVVAAISARPDTALSSGTTYVAVGLALALGVASNVVPSSHARAAPPLSPLGVPSALAPSTLLVGEQ